jgi:hypothetical protein
LLTPQMGSNRVCQAVYLKIAGFLRSGKSKNMKPFKQKSIAGSGWLC